MENMANLFRPRCCGSDGLRDAREFPFVCVSRHRRAHMHVRAHAWTGWLQQNILVCATVCRFAVRLCVDLRMHASMINSSAVNIPLCDVYLAAYSGQPTHRSACVFVYFIFGLQSLNIISKTTSQNNSNISKNKLK